MLLRRSVVLLGFPLFACTAAHGSADASQDVTVHPSGPGDDVTLTLTVPAGTLAAHYFYGGTEIQPNVATQLPYQPDARGRTAMSITVAIPDGHTLVAEATLPIVMGANTVALGAMRLTHPVPVADVSHILDPIPKPGYLELTDSTGARTVEWETSGEYPSPAPTTVYIGTPIVPTFVGHYEFVSASPSVPVQEFDVVAGQTVDAKMDEPNSFATVHLVPDPNGSELPDAIPEQSFAVGCSNATVRSKQFEQAPAGNSIGFWSQSAMTCTWSYGPASVDFDLPADGEYDAQLKRLDVDDVDLTDHPGQKAAGHYVVSLPNGTAVTGSLPTKTGISLPAGSYTITTTYAGVDGFDHTTTTSVDL